MKAIVFTDKNKMELQEAPVPKPKEGEVLIKVEACGICGVDPMILTGEYGGQFPIIPGHEYAGTIAEVGPGTRQLKIGDRVAIDPNVQCGYCEYCQSGQVHLCENLFPFGVLKPGGFAEYSICPETHAFKLTERISSFAGALIEPVACSIRGMQMANIKFGDSVVILGAGLMGCLMIQLCGLAGAGKIIASEPVASRRKLALESGADIVINPKNNDISEIIKKETRIGANVVFECVGKIETAQSAIGIARRGGKIVLYGTCPPDEDIKVNPFIMQEKELTLCSSYNNPWTHSIAVKLLDGNRIKVEHLISHKFKLEDYSAAFRIFGTEGTMKIMFTP
jgi:2-desacetyl-2-hydroxyethyl bacteriochlorophyllide A dehydrogenase